ncbi:ABC transporter substrate-binding protein [Nocardiopsis kunsanensis]|uniref:ABC transporter substrate-binding protein n=2 Tax=Nocardiopsis kunsanensis TaxID=141693 RepID=A0A919CJV1_9ACTN|nr:glutamate ABC transporter substrate-binding protein [Nocardiopsis kunsanensis]GHD31486.1 ABC transporter substrate-binding protein [Nocardiopsis kunsanensis]
MFVESSRFTDPRTLHGAPAGPGRKRHRPVTSLLAAAVGLSTLAACAASGEEASVLEGDTITIGVKFDQPGLGLGENGEFAGFDVDVAHYLAEEMGFDRDDVEMVGVTSVEREDKIIEGEVDMVVATYSITPERKTEVTFGGPYYVAKQDILVSADATDIETVRDLEGLEVCQGEGSNSASRITEGLGIDATVSEAPSYSRCIDRLDDGSADAVSTDDLILAGYLAEDPSAYRFVNYPFTDEKYGVGLPYEDVEACEAVNKAINRMYQDGTAGELLEKWFGSTDLELLRTVPQFEGCV